MQKNLVLIRHGQSEWNLKNLFTGWADVDLTDQGISEAQNAGKIISSLDFKIDIADSLDTQNWKAFIAPKEEVLIGGCVFLKNWIILLLLSYLWCQHLHFAHILRSK